MMLISCKSSKTHFITRLSCFFCLLALVGGAGDFAQALDLTGSWEGAFYAWDPASGTNWGGTVTLSIVQAGSALSFTYQSNSQMWGPDAGTGTGTINGETVSYHGDSSMYPGDFIEGTGSLVGEVLVLGDSGAVSGTPGRILIRAARNQVDESPWLDFKRIGTVTGSEDVGSLWTAVGSSAVAAATLVTPGLERLPMTFDISDDRWETSVSVAEFAAFTESFPNGVYWYELLYPDASTGIDFAVASREYPDQVPSITSPSQHALIDENLPLAISWDPWSDPGDLSPLVTISSSGGWIPLQASATSYEFAAGTFPDNARVDIEASFQIGTPYRHTKNRSTVLSVFTAPVVDQDLGIFKSTAPGGQSVGSYYVWFQAPEFASATVTTPGAETITIGSSPYDAITHGLVVAHTPLSTALSRFEDGDYTLNLSLSGGTTTTLTATIDGTFPPDNEIVSPLSMSQVPADQTLTIALAPGAAAGSLSLYEVATIPADQLMNEEVIDLVLFGRQLAASHHSWQNEAPPTTTVVIPANTLSPSRNYVAVYVPWDAPGPKGTLDWIYFTTIQATVFCDGFESGGTTNW